MNTALFEILGLLAVSCLIGIFFTYRYWKSKYASLVNDLQQSHQNNADLKSQIEKLNEDLAAANKEKTSLKEQLEAAQQKSEKKPAKDDSKQLKKDLKALKEKVALQQESLDEKEREIEALSKELSAKKISYYKQIDGKRYKAATLIKADEAVAGKGDGRISKADAESIFSTISDGKSYTQVEKDTMRYLRDHYNWTDEADALFRTKVRSWAAKGHELDQ